MRNKIQHSTFGDIDLSDFCIFIFKVNHVSMEEKDNPVENVIEEEELNGIATDSILISEDLQSVAKYYGHFKKGI